MTPGPLANDAMLPRCRVLALEPYFGGSHRAFLESWQRHSRHQWTMLTLPARHWKWRMRHAAWTFAQQAVELAASRAEDKPPWDVVFCSDMLPLAEWQGLLSGAAKRSSQSNTGHVARQIGALPTVLYFHENQLTYPVQQEAERDLHFAFTNLLSALAADETWFNSDFHRQDFFTAAETWLKRLPDHAPRDSLANVRSTSQVQWPGGPPRWQRQERPPGPLRVAWAARWEHDKGLRTLQQALTRCLDNGLQLQVSVMGEQFQHTPAAMQALKDRFDAAPPGSLIRWGFQTRAAYEQALKECDVFVSTAEHEFFGISVVEAMAAGAIVLLPRRLSYPELLAPLGRRSEPCFYAGGAAGIAAALQNWADRLGEARLWTELRELLQGAADRFGWPRRAAEMDERLSMAASRFS